MLGELLLGGWELQGYPELAAGAVGHVAHIELSSPHAMECPPKLSSVNPNLAPGQSHHPKLASWIACGSDTGYGGIQAPHKDKLGWLIES